MTRSVQLQENVNQRGRLVDRGESMVIGLLDHMGYGNLGDAAVQDSVIGNIRKRLPNARLVGFSLVPDDTINRHGIPCHPIHCDGHPTLHQAGTQPKGSRSVKAKLKSALKGTPVVYVWAKPALEFFREMTVLGDVRTGR